MLVEVGQCVKKKILGLENEEAFGARPSRSFYSRGQCRIYMRLYEMFEVDGTK